jgi:GAF domain-containing protein
MTRRSQPDNVDLFRDWLNERIRARGLSPAEVARKANITSGYLSMLRAGKRRPSYEVLVALTHALGARGELDRVLSLAGLVAAETAELQAARDERRAVEKIVSTLSTQLDVDRVACRVMDGLATLIPFDYGTIALVDEETATLTVIAHWTVDTRRAQLGNSKHSPSNWSTDDGVSGWVARNSQAQNVYDVALDARFLRHWQPTQSELAVPMVLEGKVIGVLNIESSELGHFTDHDEALLTIAARSVAVAVDRARMQAQLRTLREQFVNLSELHRTILEKRDEHALFQSLARAVVSLFPRFDMCVARMFDAEAETLQLGGVARRDGVTPSIDRVGYRLPVTTSLSGRVVLNKRYYVSADVQKESAFHQRELAIETGLHAAIVVPIPAVDIREAPIGCLSVYTTSIGYPFKRDDVTLLIDIARFTTVAVSALRSSLLLETTVETEELCRAGLHEPVTLERLCSNIATRLAASTCSIAVVAGDGNPTIYVQSGFPIRDETEDPLTRWAFEWVHRYGKSVRQCGGENNVLPHDDLVAALQQVGESTVLKTHGEAFMAVPVFRRYRVWAVISVFRSSVTHDFTRFEQEMLEQVSKQVTIALEGDHIRQIETRPSVGDST